MMPRWLVTLALFVVSNPAAAAKVEHASHKITTSTAPLAMLEAPKLARLPPTVGLEGDDLVIATARGPVRRSLSRGGAGPLYLVPIADRLVVGTAERAHAQADTLLAIDLATGDIAWRRALDSTFAAELDASLIAVERAGQLDIIDVRTGETIASTPIRTAGIQSVSRHGGGDLHVKTRGDLIAIARTGAVRWARESTARGNVCAGETSIVDGWVDRVAHRFGIVSLDPRDGRPLRSIELGETHGWYDHTRLAIAPDGPDEVLVSALFALE
ncbi:MAG TPA: PQQ-binding-like beta-propeller repeat protein [Kofleriaceae bacterium]|nr:PQQ-binding-like beta-propeller repeat protein [Kofleriaceae bacterium]